LLMFIIYLVNVNNIQNYSLQIAIKRLTNEKTEEKID
jgi:hypothetical protein